MRFFKIPKKTEGRLARAEAPLEVAEDAQGTRGFDACKRVKGRKRHILVDTLGLPIASRVEPADISGRRAGARLLSGLAPLFPGIHTAIADAGHESRKRDLLRQDGWKLRRIEIRLAVDSGPAPVLDVVLEDAHQGE
jgi:putative transposase